MKILKIDVHSSSFTKYHIGADVLILHTDLPCALFSYEEDKANQLLKTETAAGKGLEYAKQNFPDVPIRLATNDGWKDL